MVLFIYLVSLPEVAAVRRETDELSRELENPQSSLRHPPTIYIYIYVYVCMCIYIYIYT